MQSEWMNGSRGTSPGMTPFGLPLGAGGLLGTLVVGQHAVLVRLLAVGTRLLLDQQLVDDETSVGANGLFDGGGNLRVLLEERFGVLAALTDAVAVVGEPGAGFLDDADLRPEVDELAH